MDTGKTLKPLIRSLVLLGSLLFIQSGLTQDAALSGIYENGPLTMEFMADGNYRISMQGRVAIKGHFEQGEDKLSLEDTGGQMGCLDKVGKYQYRLGENLLELRASNDPCTDRSQNLPGVWNKKVIVFPIAITSGTLIDGNGGKPQKNMTIVIEAGKITDIFRSGKKRLPENAEVISAKGQYILPGLIDSHVHLATDPSGSDNHDNVKVMLRDYLYGGVTSVRDMGGDARSLTWLSRNAMVDEIESPRIYFSAIIGGPAFFSDMRTIASSRGLKSGAGPWARAFTLQDDVKLIIAEAKGTGATAIKMYAQLGAEELKVLSDEAHKQGMQVWSHVHVGPAIPSDTVAAGVDAISHSDGLAAEIFTRDELQELMMQDTKATVKRISSAKKFKKLLKDMRKNGTILDATMAVASDFGESDDPEQKRAAAAAFLSFTTMAREAHKAGVHISAGTDLPHEPGEIPPLHREMQLLVDEVGMTPLEAITSATRISAMATGIETTHGTIERGKTADIVILSKNPAQDIRNSSSVVQVLKGGKIYKR